MKKQNRVAFFNFLSVVLLRGISFFTGPIFSRMLGTGNYGVVSIYNIWVSAVAIVFSMQVAGTLPTARVEYPEEKQDGYHSSILTMAMTSFLTLSVIVMLFCRPIASALHLDTILVPLLLFHAFCNFCAQFLNQKFVYEYRADLNCLISVLVAVLTLVLSIVFIKLLPSEQGYYGRILGVALTYCTVGVFACVYILRKGKVFYNREYWKFCLPLSLPLVFYTLSDLILGQSDRVMIQHMMSDSAAGQYSYALNFAMIMFTIFTALNTSWCPFFFDDMKYGRRESVVRQGKNFAELYTVLSVGFLLLYREVFRIYASRDYWPAMNCIPVFVAGYYFNFLCTFPINYEYYRQKTKAVAVITVVVSAVNIVLNFVLIQQMGMLGAAIATTVSHSLQFLLHYGYVRLVLGEYPFPVRSWLVPGLLFLAVMVLVFASPKLWILRWCLGAALGLWELVRIKKRKSLF